MDAKTMTMPNGDVINLKDDVARAKIGTGTLDTESKELIGAVNELKGTLDGLIVTDTYNSPDQSCSNNQDYSVYITASKAGYTPLGIVQIEMLGNYSTRFSITSCKFINTTTIKVAFRANSSEAFSTSNLKIYCTVLFIKS